MIARILVPTDGSPGALEAAAYARDLARAFGAAVTILHVVEIPQVPLSPTALAAVPQVRHDLVVAGQAILAMTEETFSQTGVAVHTELREGLVAETIVEVAAQGGYDLIVIGSRGKGGIGRLLLGSVSEAVARDAPCPVLIVRKGTTSAG